MKKLLLAVLVLLVMSSAAFSEALYPNDPDFDSCWGIKKIRAPEVWPYTTGNHDIYVAVIDSGIYKHPDLLANISQDLGMNFTTVSGDYDKIFSQWDADRGSHGTHVAGTIGAVGDNALGVAGINWEVSMFAIRVLDNNEYESISEEIRALNYIASLLQKYPDMKLAAINLSLGAYFPFTPEQMKDNVYWRAYSAIDKTNRALIVVSAGNRSLLSGKGAPFDDPTVNHAFYEGEYQYPANFSGLKNFIVVGAITSDDNAAFFSNFGDSVDIAAPGFSILSTVTPERDTSTYGYMHGTSMAVPHVTGAAALLMSAFPEATPGQIKNALLNGANKNINPTVYPYQGTIDYYLKRYTAQVEKDIEDGKTPVTSRDEIIETVMNRVRTRMKPYEQFDGKYKISRNGLLDVKAAYDILASQPQGEITSSSSGGCNIAYSFTFLLFAGMIFKSIIIRK